MEPPRPAYKPPLAAWPLSQLKKETEAGLSWGRGGGGSVQSAGLGRGHPVLTEAQKSGRAQNPQASLTGWMHERLGSFSPRAS